jgi:hypothetical protein
MVLYLLQQKGMTANAVIAPSQGRIRMGHPDKRRSDDRAPHLRSDLQIVCRPFDLAPDG